MAQSKKNYFNKYSSIYYIVKIATVEKFAGGEKMKNVYTEKGKNYLIKRDREVKLTDYEITGDRESGTSGSSFFLSSLLIEGIKI